MQNLDPNDPVHMQNLVQQAAFAQQLMGQMAAANGGHGAVAVLQQAVDEQQQQQQQQQQDAQQQAGKGFGKQKPPRPDTVEICPRCGSNDTKFCYYNNYNVKQPRYFCKTCQRYWTAGGTLRNVPVGSGRRKSKTAAAKEQEKQQALAEQLAKQSVANAMLNPAALAAAVPFLNPMLTESTMQLAYNAAAQQQLLGSAALNALTKMPAGIGGQWPAGINAMGTGAMLNGSTIGVSETTGGAAGAGSSGAVTDQGTGNGTAGQDGTDDVTQQDGPSQKRARLDASVKTEAEGDNANAGNSGAAGQQQQQQHGNSYADEGAHATGLATGQTGLAGTSSGVAALTTSSGGTGGVLGTGTNAMVSNALAGSWPNLGAVDMLGNMTASAPAMTAGTTDANSMLNGGIKSPVSATTSAAAAVHNAAAAAALQQQQVLQYQQMMHAQLLQQQLAAQHVAAGLNPNNPYALALSGTLPHLTYPFSYANGGLTSLAAFNPAAASSGLQQWNTLAAQSFSPNGNGVAWSTDPNAGAGQTGTAQ